MPRETCRRCEDDLAAAKIIAELLVHFNSVPAPAGMRQLSDVAAATLAGMPDAIRLAGDPDERRLLINCAARFQELITDPNRGSLAALGSALLQHSFHTGWRERVEGDRSEAAQRRFRVRAVAGVVEPLGRSGQDR